ncbi:hypothetical protein D3C76_1371440 [compost metagenome]
MGTNELSPRPSSGVPSLTRTPMPGMLVCRILPVTSSPLIGSSGPGNIGTVARALNNR